VNGSNPHHGLVAPRISSLDGTIRTLALGGAAAHEASETLEAFRLAMRLGAGGIDSIVRLSADGVPVVSQTARIGSRLRRRTIASLDRVDLPDGIPSLADLYQQIDPASTPLLLELPDPAAFEPVLAVARAAGAEAEEQLWLGAADLDTLAAWRHRTSAHLFDSVRLSTLEDSLEQRAARLRERGIDGLSLPHGDWTGGLVTLLHRFDRYAIGRGAVHERELAAVIDAGIDAVSSANVDRMVAMAHLFYPAD
jgi:glycerophosphoryl diester phosphodiesterase